MFEKLNSTQGLSCSALEVLTWFSLRESSGPAAKGSAGHLRRICAGSSLGGLNGPASRLFPASTLSSGISSSPVMKPLGHRHCHMAACDNMDSLGPMVLPDGTAHALDAAPAPSASAQISQPLNSRALKKPQIELADDLRPLISYSEVIAPVASGMVLCEDVAVPWSVPTPLQVSPAKEGALASKNTSTCFSSMSHSSYSVVRIGHSRKLKAASTSSTAHAPCAPRRRAKAHEYILKHQRQLQKNDQHHTAALNTITAPAKLQQWPLLPRVPPDQLSSAWFQDIKYTEYISLGFTRQQLSNSSLHSSSISSRKGSSNQEFQHWEPAASHNG
ncbi:hypothetical protein Nepgr_018698 [Nepenthes gracilis]|uniref:Uncharacterized protein n=1 Tax=Nepenthes gracilis TaxID=150966 RepID=A0AAD3XTA3_NEPGR|nr:hypothetical protein Nepgr_018698 [Nepenthes gracilis]